jgi:two-component system CheB/CheR fusion protein
MLLEEAPGAVLVALEERVVFANGAALRLLRGDTPGEVLGRRLAELVPPEEREAARRLLEALVRGQEPSRVELRCQCLDGSTIDVEVAAARCAWLGQPAIQFLVHDISRRKRAEAGRREALAQLETERRLLQGALEQIQQAQEGLRYVSQHAHCLLWFADIVDDGTPSLLWTIHACDDDAAQRFFPLHVPAGERYTGVWHRSRLPEDRARTDAYGVAQVRAGQSYSQEFRCRRRDGAVRWLHEEVQIETVAPGRWKAVGVCIDVTDRKVLEEDLRQRAVALAEADRAKDQFLAMLAHELRNPLAPILNAVELMRARGDTSEEAGQALIERQVRHMSRMLDDLLDASRLTREQVTLRREPADLVAIVRAAAAAARVHMDRRGHTFTVELPEGPLVADGDPVRLEQIVVNLLCNASKYTRSPGRVWLSLEREGDGDAGWAVIRVRDTGIGIAPELLPKVFDVFTQGEQGLDRAHGGLGVGLTIVRTLTELHGGTVEARSPGVGAGSEFLVRLPLLPAEAFCPAVPAEPPSTAEPAPVAAGTRMLVVDDNRDAATTLLELAELWGYEARGASDGPSALQSAATFVPEVVLLDIGMPGMDGYEVARELRARPEMGGALLVAITGYGREEDKQKAREAGFDHHLTKPIDAAELHRLLSAAVAGPTEPS